MSLIIGIDPGASGAVAILENGKLIEVWDMPTVQVLAGKSVKRRVSPEMLAAELRNWAAGTAFVEQVNAMPGQGVSSMFAFGESLGVIRGVLAGLAIPCHLVPPARWKKAVGVNAGKDGCRAKAAQMWPAQAGEFARVKDDGRAEAALIAYWGTVSF